MLYRLNFTRRLRNQALLLQGIALLLLLLLNALPATAALIQSPSDLRQYETFILPNQLRVLVVSDPQADKAAAALNIQVGSNANPPGREGLAHFLEHMLFLGTEKYPEADAYQQFISANGGSHNAFTAYDQTTFFFDIKADALPDALDRFAQFFIAPLFSPDYVDRERHAVHSEFKAKIRDDGRRLYVASKLAMNPKHPYSRFMVGNLDTLSDRDGASIRDDLIQFYETHYSANLMSLVVIGPDSTESLHRLAEQTFSAVPDRHLIAQATREPLYSPQRLPLQTDVKTLMQTRQLQLTFPVDPVREHWRIKPLDYIASQIGYEGAGSLLSRLKALGWARALGASTGLDLAHSATFDVSIELTDDGFAHYQQVVALFFDYVERLKQQGVQVSLYDEEAQLAATRFRFLERGEPIHEATRLAGRMPLYPIVHLLDAPYRYDYFDPGLIRHYLDQLNPNNLMLLRAAPDLATTERTPRYEIDYSLHPPAQAALALWQHPQPDAALQVRATNPFIAKQFGLIEPTQAQQAPTAIWHRDDARLWYLPDQTFKVPRADFYFALLSPSANASARNAMLSTLYTRMVDDRLNETLYDASLAGLDVQLYPHLRGVSLRISGYNDREPVLLDTLLDEMTKLPASQARFERLKHELQEELENEAKQKPYNQTFAALYCALMPEWTATQKLDALQALSLDDLRQFQPQLFQHARLRLLAHGNLSADTATQMAQKVHATLLTQDNQATASELPVVQLPAGQRLYDTLDIEHNDSALTLYLQGADTAVNTRAEVALLNEIISTPFYNELRTERQLGYIVFSTYMPLRQVAGLALVVQSPVSDPVALEREYDRFLDEMTRLVETLPEAQLDGFKQSLIARINQQDNRLSDRSERLWRELDRGNTAFDTREQLSAATRAIDGKQLLVRLQQLRQRQLALRSFGNQVAGGSREDDTSALMALKSQAQFVPGS